MLVLLCECYDGFTFCMGILLRGAVMGSGVYDGLMQVFVSCMGLAG